MPGMVTGADDLRIIKRLCGNRLGNGAKQAVHEFGFWPDGVPDAQLILFERSMFGHAGGRTKKDIAFLSCIFLYAEKSPNKGINLDNSKKVFKGGIRYNRNQGKELLKNYFFIWLA